MLNFDNQQKKCGFCGESIPAGAGRCPYCGSILEVGINSDYRISEDNRTADDVNTANSGNEQTDYSQAANSQSQDTFESNTENGGNHSNNAESNNQAQKPIYKSSEQNFNNQYVPYSHSDYGNRKQLSNGIKVLLTAIAVGIPGLGQLIGIIAAIIFMNAEGDSDRKSFGVALLVASLIVFVLACIGCFVLAMIGASAQGNFNQFLY